MCKLNITINNSWQNKKYIYLDWNVFKYMSSPRSDKGNIDIDMLNMVKKLKSKYIFPYSEGHIKDRSSRFKAEYRAEVEKDLEFVKTITDDYLLISRSQIPDVNIRQKEIIIVKKPMLDHIGACHRELFVNIC